jgi:hypothetical protein
VQHVQGVSASTIEGGIVLAINLSDLRQAVLDYLENKVTILIGPFNPLHGHVINPKEVFTFNVGVRNASAADGGIALTNVRYQVSVSNGNVATIRVPGNGTSIDRVGQPIAAGSEVGFFIFTPGSATPEDTALSQLGVGEFNSLFLTGRGGSNSAGGSATITVRIKADLELFQNQLSSEVKSDVTVIGD